MEDLINHLRLLYQKHLSLSLPTNPQSDDLSEAIDQIIELDGYIVGFVTSYLESNKIPQDLSLDLLKRSRAELAIIDDLSEEDKRAFISSDQYLSSLEAMAEVLGKFKTKGHSS